MNDIQAFTLDTLIAGATHVGIGRSHLRFRIGGAST